MASSSEPKIVTVKCGAAISKGMVVKHDSSDDHVIKSAASTNKHIGIAQVAATTAEDLIEIALPGGGAKGLCGSVAVTRGDLLTADSTGALASTTSANDRIIGVAMASAVSGDLFDVQVVAGAW